MGVPVIGIGDVLVRGPSVASRFETVAVGGSDHLAVLAVLHPRA